MTRSLRGVVLAGLAIALSGPAATADVSSQPPELIVGVDADTAPMGRLNVGWTAPARVLRDDPVTGSAHRLDVPKGWTAPETSVGVAMELYVLSGRLALETATAGAGDLMHVPPGRAYGPLQAMADTSVLVFLAPRAADGPAPDEDTAGGWRLVRGDDVAWVAGQVAREAGVDVPLTVKTLRQDPATGARTFLVRVPPGVAVPWETHATDEEGYLIEGDFRLAECLPDGPVVLEYDAGGYFYRPAGLLHSGPRSTTTHGAIWLIRTPRTLDSVFHPACPSGSPYPERAD